LGLLMKKRIRSRALKKRYDFFFIDSKLNKDPMPGNILSGCVLRNGKHSRFFCYPFLS
jgi:hypothetical protein